MQLNDTFGIYKQTKRYKGRLAENKIAPVVNENYAVLETDKKDKQETTFFKPAVNEKTVSLVWNGQD